MTEKREKQEKKLLAVVVAVILVLLVGAAAYAGCWFLASAQVYNGTFIRIERSEADNGYLCEA
jgi:flagellar basal body-associated protein FliL